MYRDIVDCATPKMSAHTSSMMFCLRYPQVTTSASRKVQLARASFTFIPRFFEEFADHLLQFIELR